MKRKITLNTLFLLAALPFGALAADPQPAAGGMPPADMSAPPSATIEPSPLFKQLDANHDGYVTPEEAKRSAEVTARFGDLDTNHDGRVSAPEFGAATQAKP
jgi:hypothetical protein